MLLSLKGYIVSTYLSIYLYLLEVGFYFSIAIALNSDCSLSSFGEPKNVPRHHPRVILSKFMVT